MWIHNEMQTFRARCVFKEISESVSRGLFSVSLDPLPMMQCNQCYLDHNTIFPNQKQTNKQTKTCHKPGERMDDLFSALGTRWELQKQAKT